MNRLPKLYCVGVLALALLLAASAPVALADDVKGTILTIEPDNHVFDLVTEDGELLNLRMVLTADVFVNDQSRTIWDLQPGDQVEVRFNREEEEMIATAIRCTRD